MNFVGLYFFSFRISVTSSPTKKAAFLRLFRLFSCLMYDPQDLLLLLRLHADAVQSLPGTAVRADRRSIIRPRYRRMLRVGLPASRTKPCLICFRFHTHPPYCRNMPLPESVCQSRNRCSLPRRSGNTAWSEHRSFCSRP